MDFAEFLRVAHANPNMPAEQRRGQYMFNMLYALRPDLSERIRATPQDPFYDDTRIPTAIAWLAQHWND